MTSAEGAGTAIPYELICGDLARRIATNIQSFQICYAKLAASPPQGKASSRAAKWSRVADHRRRTP
jgi:hypothetical protein